MENNLGSAREWLQSNTKYPTNNDTPFWNDMHEILVTYANLVRPQEVTDQSIKEAANKYAAEVSISQDSSSGKIIMDFMRGAKWMRSQLYPPPPSDIRDHIVFSEPPTYHRIDRWISVDERLPEKNMTLLAYTNKSRMVIVDYMDGAFDDYPLAYEEDGEKYTHWVPLPPPPDTGKEG